MCSVGSLNKRQGTTPADRQKEHNIACVDIFYYFGWVFPASPLPAAAAASVLSRALSNKRASESESAFVIVTLSTSPVTETYMMVPQIITPIITKAATTPGFELRS